MSVISIKKAETCPPINQVSATDIGAVALKAELHLVTETDIAPPTLAETFSSVNNNICDNMDFWQKSNVQSGTEDPYKSYSFWTGGGLLRANMEAAEKRHAARQALRHK